MVTGHNKDKDTYVLQGTTSDRWGQGSTVKDESNSTLHPNWLESITKFKVKQSRASLVRSEKNGTIEYGKVEG